MFETENLNDLPWDQLDLYQAAVLGFRAPKKATRAVLILVILSVVFPILIFAGVTYYSYSSHIGRGRERLTHTVGVVGESVFRSVGSINSVAKEVDASLYGLTDEQIRTNQDNLHQKLKAFVTGVEEIDDILILNRDGIGLVSGRLSPFPEKLDLSDLSYYRVHRDGFIEPGAALVSQVSQGPIQERTVFQFSWPRKNEHGEFGGVISISVEPSYFSDFFATFLNKGASAIALVRDDGAVLAQSPARQRDLPGMKIAPGILAQIKQNAGGGFFQAALNVDGGKYPYLIAYDKVPGAPIYVVANVNKNRILAAWKDELLKMLSFGGPLMLGLWGFGAVAYRVTRIRDEVEQRFQQFAEHSSAVIWTMNSAKMRFDYLSPAFETLCGLDRQEAMDHPRKWARKLHPEDRHRVLRAMAKLGSGRFYTMEYRLVEPLTGSIKWIKDIGFPIANGWIGGITVDVTEKRRTDDQIQLLSEEVTHRAKNLLAVVLSIARQTAAKSDPAEFAEEFTQRIAGLAASLDLVVKSDWRGVGLKRLVTAQLALFLDLKEDQVSISGPALIIQAPAAQTLGMALHELATNSIKYGALSTAQGRISIEWGIMNEGGNRYFHMSWSETGGPEPKAPTRNGFGYAVIVRAVEYTLSARVGIQFIGPGVVWDLIAPLEAILDDTKGTLCETVMSEG